MRRASAVSSFWQGAAPAGLAGPARIEASDLATATRIACGRDDLGVAFRRNRELVDVNGRFRHFRFRDGVFVAKIRSRYQGLVERGKAAEAAARLGAASDELDVAQPTLVTLDRSRLALVLPDMGETLAEDMTRLPVLMPPTRWSEVLGLLLRCGIAWRGFLPRNVIVAPDSGRLKLIDWETATFSRWSESAAVDDLTLLFWLLGWPALGAEGMRGLAKMVQATGATAPVAAPSDGFEHAFAGLVDTELGAAVRRRCTAATLQSEGPAGDGWQATLAPSELGHVMDDLVSPSLSVLYTFASAEYRRRRGPALFARFGAALERGLQLALAAAGAAVTSRPDRRRAAQVTTLGLLACLDASDDRSLGSAAASGDLVGFFDALAPVSVIARAADCLPDLAGQRGWSAATRRAALVDELVDRTFTITSRALDLGLGVELLLRGSAAHRLLSTRSDVDFEISGRFWPRGCPSLELVVGAVLEAAGLAWDGSGGRPSERDLEAPGGISRDLHEYSELRRPMSCRHDPGWVVQALGGVAAQWWERTSEFERTGVGSDAKAVFFEARTLVARAAHRSGVAESCTECQLSGLAGVAPDSAVRLGRLVAHALELYERDALDDECQMLAGAIRQMRVELGLPPRPETGGES